MLFKFLVLLGKLTKLPGLPMCRVWNDVMTESYTLRWDGLVIVQSKGDKSYVGMPVGMVSEKLIEKFDKELGGN